MSEDDKIAKAGTVMAEVMLADWRDAQVAHIRQWQDLERRIEKIRHSCGRLISDNPPSR